MTKPRIFGIEDLPELVQLVQAGDWAAIEDARVAPDHQQAPKNWSKDLLTEWTMLMRQYGPGTAIGFTVPILTPLLRRKIDFDRNFALFNDLWAQYEDRLMRELSTRWLVSVCDTFIKDPRTPEEEAWAFAGAFFMKTIKLYETEELRLDQHPDLGGPVKRVDVTRMNEEYGRVMLFDGIQPFNVDGYGDMIDKMRKRLERVKSSTLAYKIMVELFDRAHTQNTVYRRIENHVRTVKGNRV